jgi:uncharacterized Zn finger protein (UPF0148 family)
MPVCPNCGYEYVEGVTFCPDCQEALVPNDMITPPEEWTEENWQVVYTSGQEYEVEMIKDNLESAGITSAILTQKDRNFPAPGDLSTVKLLVKKEDLQDALNFIQNLKNEPGTEESQTEEEQ